MPAALQQHGVLIADIDNRRRARHDQLQASGHRSLLDGRKHDGVATAGYVNRIQHNSRHSNASPRYENGPVVLAPGMVASGSNSSSNASGGAGRANGSTRGRGGTPGFSGRMGGKGKERARTPAGFSGPNENAEELRRQKSLKSRAYGDQVYSATEESLRNDLSQNYLNTGRRPQNMLQGCDLEERFSECVSVTQVRLHTVALLMVYVGLHFC